MPRKLHHIYFSNHVLKHVSMHDVNPCTMNGHTVAIKKGTKKPFSIPDIELSFVLFKLIYFWYSLNSSFDIFDIFSFIYFSHSLKVLYWRDILYFFASFLEILSLHSILYRNISSSYLKFNLSSQYLSNENSFLFIRSLPDSMLSLIIIAYFYFIR